MLIHRTHHTDELIVKAASETLGLAFLRLSWEFLIALHVQVEIGLVYLYLTAQTCVQARSRANHRKFHGACFGWFELPFL